MLNATLYTVLICLFFYNGLQSTFRDYGLFELGTFVFVSLVHSLQCKVSFMHHQWNFLSCAGMLVSVFGVFAVLYYLSGVASDTLSGGYWGVTEWVVRQGVFWFFGAFSVPLFTMMIDFIGHSYYLFFSPTDEMRYREAELKDIMVNTFHFSYFKCNVSNN